MDNKEAIAVLKKLQDFLNSDVVAYPKDIEALTLAIEALEVHEEYSVAFCLKCGVPFLANRYYMHNKCPECCLLEVGGKLLVERKENERLNRVIDIINESEPEMELKKLKQAIRDIKLPEKTIFDKDLDGIEVIITVKAERLQARNYAIDECQKEIDKVREMI